MAPTKQSSIIVVGAGVLGLSTALGLLESGYENVTIFDQQDFEESEYSPFRGADSASADTLKVIRSAYGGASLHHSLATEAIAAWKEWNGEAGRELFVNCGWMRMSGTGDLAPVDVATLATMAAAGQGATQYRVGDPEDRQRARQDGWPTTKVDPFDRLRRGFAFDGVLDTLAGYVHASKACTFALRKAKRLGANIVLGTAGRVDAIVYAPASAVSIGDHQTVERAIGVRTGDGLEHLGDVVIVAAGARTHGLVPDLAQSVTASGANIIHIDVPPRLQDKFRADVFPVFSWGYTGFDEDGGLSGFPLDDDGTLKFLYRSPKWTNPIQSAATPSARASVTSRPTAWTSNTRTNVPKNVLDAVKAFIASNIPDLVGCEILMAKLCWDSFALDLDFVIDWVPGRENLLVVAGGSGHGKYVVKVVEDRPDQYTQLWKWRNPSPEQMTKFEAFMLDPQHRLGQQQMATISDLKWEDSLGGGAKL
ncbi:sarcosine oxidase [Grosmannia clavigera kw1407]|uniref:Sarcosine oxidase n=1 Tax=Grosmannia clavigera (strain kw1407 / UAMH 11150) TaxID=655863 RepID=F0XGK5_GROCL|nr:sarcosine oxidase [Grosmannia clavigera kw1407]EFX03276.1 sarcosine oxidase [Grosmannia clavigera kw1407]